MSQTLSVVIPTHQQREAGYRAAFTVATGTLRRDTDPLRVPRAEIRGHDQGLRLLAKVATAGRSPAWEAALRRRLVWLAPLRRLIRGLPGAS